MRARHRHFNPKDAGATLALDARFISASNNDTIQTWTSRTGSNDATQATAAARPTYKTNIQGGQPALRFDGGDHLGFAANIISGTPDGFAVFVYKVDADPPTSGTGPVLGDFGSATQNNHWPFSDGTIYDDFGSNARKTAGNPTPSLANMRVISQHSATNDFVIFIDGSQFYSTATNTVAWSSTQRIGASGNPNWFLLGHIGSAAFLPLKPTDAMRKRMEHASAYSFKISCN